MAFWAAAAPILGAAVDWISGERAARKARKNTKQVATDEAYGSVAGRVEAAKAMGLHPLAALGTPSSSGANVGGALTDFASVGQEFGRSVTQQRQWKAEQDFQRAQQSDARALANRQETREQARLNADLARSAAEIEQSRKQGDWIDEQIRASREESLRRNLSSTKPLVVPPKKDIPTQYIDVRDRFGNIVSIPNPDIYDLELPSIIGAGTLVLPETSSNPIIDKIRGKWNDYKRQRREIDARNPRLNPYGLPTPIGD